MHAQFSWVFTNPISFPAGCHLSPPHPPYSQPLQIKCALEAEFCPMKSEE